jgi:nitric oxide reductase large subunit
MSQKLNDFMAWCFASFVLLVVAIPMAAVAIALWIYTKLPDWPDLDTR